CDSAPLRFKKSSPRYLGWLDSESESPFQSIILTVAHRLDRQVVNQAGLIQDIMNLPSRREQIVNQDTKTHTRRTFEPQCLSRGRRWHDGSREARDLANPDGTFLWPCCRGQ